MGGGFYWRCSGRLVTAISSLLDRAPGQQSAFIGQGSGTVLSRELQVNSSNWEELQKTQLLEAKDDGASECTVNQELWLQKGDS